MASTPTRQRVRLDRQGFRRCSSEKVGYPSYDAAYNVAEPMMLQGKVHPGCHLTPYECDECEEWHVGNRVIVSIGRRRSK